MLERGEFTDTVVLDPILMRGADHEESDFRPNEDMLRDTIRLHLDHLQRRRGEVDHLVLPIAWGEHSQDRWILL